MIKYSGVQINTGLREGGRALSQSRERHRARKALVVVQVALALVLLICSGLMIRTFRALANVSPGFADPATLLKFRIYVPESTVSEKQKANVVHLEQAIADKLAAIPNVSSVAYSTHIPMDGNDSNDLLYAQDHTYREGELPPIRRFVNVSPGFFSTMGTPLVAGRDLTWAETYQKRPVALVSENLAREYWGTPDNALGKQIRVANTDDWREIIGVAKDVYYDGVSQKATHDRVLAGVHGQVRRATGGSAARRVVCHSLAACGLRRFHEPGAAGGVVRQWRSAAGRSRHGRRALYQVDGAHFVHARHALRRRRHGAAARHRRHLRRDLVCRFAAHARDRHSHGARRSTRCTRPRCLSARGCCWLPSARFSASAAAFATMRFMASILFKVSPMDPWTYSLATDRVIGIAWLACYLPSRRAAQVNPVNALRAE